MTYLSQWKSDCKDIKYHPLQSKSRMLSLKTVTWFSAIWIVCLIVAFSVEFAWNTKELDLDFDSAWEIGDLDTLEYIISHELDQNSKNELLFKACKEKNNTEIARFLLKNGASLKATDHNGFEFWDPLMAAVVNKNPEMTKLFLDFGADIIDKNEDTNNPSRLLIAVENNDFQTAKVLIDHGANVNSYMGIFPLVTRPLYEAAKINNTEMAKYIIEHGAAVRNHEWKPLSYAISQGNLEILQLLINAGANVNVKHPYGDFSILSVAAHHGNIKAMKLLIKNGANVDAKDIEGKKPLDFAVEGGNVEAIKLLIAEKGINLEN